MPLMEVLIEKDLSKFDCNAYLNFEKNAPLLADNPWQVPADPWSEPPQKTFPRNGFKSDISISF